MKLALTNKKPLKYNNLDGILYLDKVINIDQIEVSKLNLL